MESDQKGTIALVLGPKAITKVVYAADLWFPHLFVYEINFECSD